MRATIASCKFLLTILVLVSLSEQIYGLVFYDHRHHQGRYFRAPGGWADYQKCNNMEHWFNDQASSINTEGHCVIVYDHGDCRGESRRVFPGSCCHGNIDQIQMNDRISSYRGC